jgi:hypothetical protein
MSDAAIGPTPRLNCRPSKTGNLLIFPYTLENPGPAEVYVIDALPAADPASREAKANDLAAVVIASDDGDAIVGKFLAPLPTDRRIAIPMLPLVRRLAPGATIEGRIETPLPLAETSPYFPDLTLRGYEVTDIKGVLLTIGYWDAAPQEIVVRQSAYGPEFLAVAGADLPHRARRVMQRFPTTGLQLFRRTDAFPRSLP